MFKAKIVENTEYYKLKRRTSVLLGFFILVLILIQQDFGFWQVLVVITVLIAFFVVEKKWISKMNSMVQKHTLKLDLNGIEVIDKKKNVIKSFIPSVLKQIELVALQALPAYDVGDVRDEFIGPLDKNRIIIDDGNDKYEYEFLIDSHYMLKQLDKIIEHWSNQNIPLTVSRFGR